MSAALQQPPGSISRQGWQILLISANRCVTPEPVFPLGLAHLTAALKAAGHQVEWLDLLADEQQFELRLSKFQPNLVAISVRNVDDVLIRRQETFVGGLPQLVQNLRRKFGCPVVLGGSGFSILPREIFELAQPDFGIVGEGEVALAALIDALKTGSKSEAISGLVFRRGGRVVLIERDKSLTPRWIPKATISRETAEYYLLHGGVLNVQTQRGCAHRCCFCTYPLIEGARHRARVAEEVAEEFEHLERLGARYAFIVDSVFNSSSSHLVSVCEALIRRKLKIRWGCFLRPQGIDPETMELMARAGLSHIEFGSDSFCDQTLEQYQKDFSFDDIRRSTELARREGIDFCHFLIAGGPGETLETLQIGFENSKQLAGAVIMAVPGMRIYPGTPLFERAVMDGRLERGCNLLKPAYYLAQGLTIEGVLEKLNEFARRSPNWIIGDFNPAYEKLVGRLRQRGVAGPLWSYFAAAQRLFPQQ